MHTTKFGNTYTDQEWAEKQAEFQTQAENAQKVRKMKNWAARQMNEKGLNGNYLKDHIVFLPDMIEAGRLSVSPETAIWLCDLTSRYLEATDKLEKVTPIG